MRRFHGPVEADNCYPIYGLIRSSTLKRTRLFGDTMMPDVVLLNELSCWGVRICAELFYLRRLPRPGRLNAFLEKLKIELSPWSALYLYLSDREHLQAVDVSGYTERRSWRYPHSCMLIKYGWVPAATLLSSIRKRACRDQPCLNLFLSTIRDFIRLSMILACRSPSSLVECVSVKIGDSCRRFGTRLAEETELKPKPMVEVGERPILWHIMKHYAHYGMKEFYIALGYKGEVIKRYWIITGWTAA